MRRMFKWTLRIVLVLLAAMLVIIAAVQLPPVQTRIVQHITRILAEQTGTVIHIAKVSIRFPKTLNIKGLYLEDGTGDTLLFVNRVGLNIRMLALLNNKVYVSRAELAGFRLNIVRNQADSTFNYTFLLDAFAPTDTLTRLPERQQGNIEFRLGRISLTDLSFSYRDEVSVQSITSHIQKIGLTPVHIDPDLSLFHIESARLSQGHFSLASGNHAPAGGVLDPNNFSIDNLDVSVGDLYFSPDSLAVSLENLACSISETPVVLHARGTARGTLSALRLIGFRADIPGLISAEMDASVTDLLHPDKLVASIDTAIVTLSPGHDYLAGLRSDISALVVWPDTLTVGMKGYASLREGDMLASMTTDVGQLMLDGRYQFPAGEEALYRARLSLRDLQAGQILGIDLLTGGVTADLHIEGQGVSLHTARADLNATIGALTVNDYALQGLSLNGGINSGIVDAEINYYDKALHTEMDFRIDMGADHPNMDAVVIVHHALLHDLLAAGEHMSLTTRLQASLMAARSDFLTGFVRLDSTRLITADRQFTLDSLLVETSIKDELFLASLESGIGQISYSGNISPMLMADVVMQQMQAYFSMPAGKAGQVTEPHHFSLEVRVPPSEWLTQVLVSDLHAFEPISLKADFDSETGIWLFEGTIAALEYDAARLKGLTVSAAANSAALNFDIGMSELDYGTMRVLNPQLQGRFHDQQLTFTVAFDDEELINWLSLSGKLQVHNGNYLLAFSPDAIIYRDTWRFGPDHFIRYGPDDFWVENLAVTSPLAGLSVQSLAALPADTTGKSISGLAIELTDVDIEKLSAPFTDMAMAGILRAEVKLYDIFDKFHFDASIDADHVSLMGDTIGDISLRVDSPEAAQFLFRGGISNFGTRADISGTYQHGEVPAIDMQIRVPHFDLKTAEGLMQGVLEDISGALSGEIRVRGNPVEPLFVGALRIQDASFRAVVPNVRFSMVDERILFDNSRVQLSNFSIRDSLGRVAAINGFVDIADFSNPRFDLGFTTNNLLGMHVPQGRNELFSGRMFITSNIRLRGDLDRPVAEGSLKLNQGSNFTLIVPQSNPRAIGDAGVVVFLHPDSIADLSIDLNTNSGSAAAAFSRLMLSLNIDIDKATDVRVIIDEYAGDYLMVRGGGLLSIGADPGGRMTLSGRYELAEGTYLMTFYDVVRRQFEIVSGSHMTWRGNPENPTVDIRAVYNIRTSARELFESANAAPVQTDAALRQTFPFQVFLHMKGQLLNPEIDFRIDLAPEQQYALDGRIQARLNELNQHESERNKQVFALLMAGSFLPDNPLASGLEGPGLSATARSSASRILTQQLNRLSDQYIRGIDIQFDIDSYQDPVPGLQGGSTQLNLELSKDFFDERVRVSLGGNIELEDESRRSTSAGDIAGDFTIEYLLNRQGTWLLKGFRRKEFRDLFEGQVIETGVSLRFQKTLSEEVREQGGE